jgi:hypothetical protein
MGGFLDVISRGDGKALVLDYKTNLLDERSLEEVVEREYRLQRLVYALACLRAGYGEVEIVYHFLERPEAAVSRIFLAEETSKLERELGETIAAIGRSDFPPTPSERVCADCPALDLVCAGMNLPSAPAGSPPELVEEP